MVINQCWVVDHDRIIILSFPIIPILGTTFCYSVIFVVEINDIVLCVVNTGSFLQRNTHVAYD